MHLTNYAINKDATSFKMAKNINDDFSHKRSLTKVMARLKKDGIDVDQVMGDIKDVIVKTIIPI
jgi:phosphopentomutase